MQDVTDRPFMRLMAGYGGPDVYFTEYFRVHATSHLEPWILESITQNPTGRPIIAQMIGNDPAALVRTARELQEYPVAAVDFNLGCPAPIVYRKCAGGGLLRDLAKIDAFDELLPIFARHHLDLLTVHGRTVMEMYRSEVHYDYIARAVDALACPVLANGNIYSAARAGEILQRTGAAGLMIGRGAIRNPWLFEQIRRRQLGEPVFVPDGPAVLAYIRALYDAVCSPGVRESAQVQKMKKYLNFVGLGVEPTGKFLHRIRRVTTRAVFFAVCENFLSHDQLMPLEPFPLALKETDVLAGEHG